MEKTCSNIIYFNVYIIEWFLTVVSYSYNAAAAIELALDLFYMNFFLY